MLEIQQLTAADIRLHVDNLADILVDCVEGGASVSFMSPLSKHDANRFFEKVAGDVVRNERVLLAAFADSELVGTVQVLMAMPPNQPHRAEIAKLLMLRSARGQGIGTELMRHAEQCARKASKRLLVLDTVTGGDAEKLHVKLGWVRAGIIPNYAMLPDGTLCATTIFWKALI